MKHLLRTTLSVVVASALLACGSTDEAQSSNVTEGAGGQSHGSGGAGGAGGQEDPFAESLVLELGEVQPDVDVPFEVPEGTLGFHVQLRTTSPLSSGLEQIVDPTGEVVFDQYSPVGSPAPLGWGLSSDGYAATAVPNNVPATLRAGTWWLRAGGTAADARVYLQHTDDGAFHGGELDMHVYIPDGLPIEDPTPSHALTAADAATDEAVALRIDTFYIALQDLFGIGRGDVTFHAIDASYAQVLDEATFHALIAESQAGGDGQQLHMVWVSHLEPWPDFNVWGLSPRVPGDTLTAGTHESAVALAINPLFGAVADGFTMLHEMGHFMGLSHTTELEGGYQDPLIDTPFCADIATQPQSCPDRTNLMFPTYWGATGGVGVTVTESQRRIVRASPSYRALRTGAAPSMPDFTPPPGSTEGGEQRDHRGAETTATPLRCGHARFLPAPVTR